MFGCDAFYLRGRLVLVLTPGKDEPWKGMLVPTFRESHEALMREFPGLEPHAVLGKWLYLSEAADEFEEIAERVVRGILKGHSEIGIDPEPGKRRAKSGTRKAR